MAKPAAVLANTNPLPTELAGVEVNVNTVASCILLHRGKTS
jgi:hypothetical protein